MFVGRTEEKKVLHDFFANNSKKAALVFGKRRVGKSTLIIEASRDFDGIVIFFECGKVSLERNIESFSKTVSSVLNISLSSSDFESIFSVLKLLNKKVLVIIDCVIENNRKNYSVYEVKFYSSPMTKEDVEEEIDKIKQIAEIDVIKYGVVSSSGFIGPKLDGVDYITGEDLFS